MAVTLFMIVSMLANVITDATGYNERNPEDKGWPAICGVGIIMFGFALFFDGWWR